MDDLKGWSDRARAWSCPAKLGVDICVDPMADPEADPKAAGMETVPTFLDPAILAPDTPDHETCWAQYGMSGERVDGCGWGGGTGVSMTSMWWLTRKRWGWRPF